MAEHTAEFRAALARELERVRGEWGGWGSGTRGDVGLSAGAPPQNQDATRGAAHHHQTIADITNPSPPNASSDSPAPAPRGVHFVAADARVADFIDHTLLKAEATAREIDTLCDEAIEHRFAAVCVNPSWIQRCAQRLNASSVQLATVIGFPLGATSTKSKQRETEIAIDDGATELDMVVALGRLKSAEWSYVADDIAAVVDAARDRLVKVIIESATLTPDEIVHVCTVAHGAGAHYVKTSTGFHPAGGASAEAVALMRLVVGDALGVKASGGVRDCVTALRMIANGATRIGTSSGVAMAQCRGAGPRPVRELFALGVPQLTADIGAAPKGESY